MTTYYSGRYPCYTKDSSCFLAFNPQWVNLSIEPKRLLNNKSASLMVGDALFLLDLNFFGLLHTG